MSKWVDRKCCDWDTFLTDVMGACERLKFPLVLIDRCAARRAWRRHSCTGAEVVKMQRLREIAQAEYLYFTPRKGRRAK